MTTPHTCVPVGEACDLALVQDDMPYRTTRCFYAAMTADCAQCVAAHFRCLERHHWHALRSRLLPVVQSPHGSLRELEVAKRSYENWEAPQTLWRWLRRRRAPSAVLKALLPLLRPRWQRFEYDTHLTWLGGLEIDAFTLAAADCKHVLEPELQELLTNNTVQLPASHTQLLATRLWREPDWAHFLGFIDGPSVDGWGCWWHLGGTERAAAQRILQDFENKFGQGRRIVWAAHGND